MLYITVHISINLQIAYGILVISSYINKKIKVGWLCDIHTYVHACMYIYLHIYIYNNYTVYIYKVAWGIKS